MGSMIPTSISFLLFIFVIGLVWLISDTIISSVMSVLPIPDDPYWAAQREVLHGYISLLLPASLIILFVFAALKLLINTGSRGYD